MIADYISLFEVRLANYNDVDSIMQITREAFMKYKELAGTDHVEALSETAEDIRHDISTKIVLIALSDGEPVGSVRVDVRADHTAYLTRFGVKISCQNSGIGKSIMNLVDRIMRKKGVKKIYLHTGAKITPLIRFYYGRGFYIDSTDKSQGYVRALLVKEYE